VVQRREGGNPLWETDGQVPAEDTSYLARVSPKLSAASGAGVTAGGRGLLSSTFQLNLSRF